MSPFVIYARKSSESEDRQVLSIDSQIKELHALAARSGVAVNEVLTESHSAKAPGRPVFSDLMRQIERGKVRGVLCWKLDRLARNHLDTGRVLHALSTGQLQRVLTPERTYTGDGNDRFMGNFELGMATKYIDDLRANVKRGNRALLEKGIPNFRPPLGYLRDKDTHAIVEDPVRFPLVRRMWELLLTGAMNPSAIRKIATKELGLRTRKTKHQGDRPITPSGMYHLFGNPFYTGLIQLRDGRTYPGTHTAMISREEFDRAQDIMGRPTRPKPQKHAFPYTGLITCATCGGCVTAEVHTKPSGKTYTYYRCTHQKTGKPCREPAVSASQIEEQFAAMLGRLTMPRPVLDWLLKKARQQIEGEEARREQVLAAQRAALESTKRQEETLLDLRLRELVTDEVFEQRKHALGKHQRELEAKLEAATNPAAKDLTAKVEQILRFGEAARKAFLSGTVIQRRATLEAVASNYTLRGRRVAFQLEQPFAILSRANGYSNWWGTIDNIRTWLLNTPAQLCLTDLHDLSNADIMTHDLGNA
jgi:site-specific DNA recombinase